jgi:hypothetical protein
VGAPVDLGKLVLGPGKADFEQGSGIVAWCPVDALMTV